MLVEKAEQQHSVRKFLNGKKEIMESYQKSKDMNIPYAPYTGVDVVAPAQG